MRPALGGGNSSNASLSEVEPLVMSSGRDDGSLASDTRSYVEIDDSSNADVAGPLTNRKPQRPRILRQRNSGPSTNDPSSGKENVSSNDDNQGTRSRKQSDYDKGLPLEQITTRNRETSVDFRVGRLRSREEIVLHFMVELQMLWRDFGVVFVGTLMQWIHSVFTNIAYYYHTQLSAAQRIPLKDIAYETLPVLSGAWWMISEYLVYTMVVIIVVAINSCLVIRWKAPHGRPLYSVPILRRLLLTLTVCQVLRCISFLVTTLPGASRQCLYNIPESMSRDEMIYGVAHDRGNPSGWSPPESMYDILWRVDATNGCGDLMFSSHTIFTCLFVCVIWHYFNWWLLKWFMLAVQIVIIPFILAAHKHYSVDIFTALYVTPLVYEVLKLRFPDYDAHSKGMKSHYGITFEPLGNGFLLRARGVEYFVEPFEVPMDLRRTLPVQTSLNQSAGEDDQYHSELDPMIV